MPKKIFHVKIFENLFFFRYLDKVSDFLRLVLGMQLSHIDDKTQNNIDALLAATLNVCKIQKKIFKIFDKLIFLTKKIFF